MTINEVSKVIVNVKFDFGFIFEGFKKTEPRKKSLFNP